MLQKAFLKETYKKGSDMAGVLGFEPRNAGIKTQCLTAWRYPKRKKLTCVSSFRFGNKMAGVLGFEPRNAGIKTQCLTAWRYSSRFICKLQMVRDEGLEPTHLSAPEPKSGASTNFASPANGGYNEIRTCDPNIMSVVL